MVSRSPPSPRELPRELHAAVLLAGPNELQERRPSFTGIPFTFLQTRPSADTHRLASLLQSDAAPRSCAASEEISAARATPPARLRALRVRQNSEGCLP